VRKRVKPGIQDFGSDSEPKSWISKENPIERPQRPIAAAFFMKSTFLAG
jgi:hypothetical protein